MWHPIHLPDQPTVKMLWSEYDNFVPLFDIPYHFMQSPKCVFSEATSWHHYISVAESCSLQSSWQRALWLIFHSALPPEFRFSAAISACKNAMVKGRAYPVGLWKLISLWIGTIDASLVGDTEAADLWQKALALYAASQSQEDKHDQWYCLIISGFECISNGGSVNYFCIQNFDKGSVRKTRDK